MQCPHCGKLIKVVRAGEFPVEDHDPHQQYLPVADLDDALREHAEDLEIIIGEGKTTYAPKQFFKDKQKWISINKIIKAHGG